MVNKPSLLSEAKRLYDLGFGILWLKPKSKAPVKSKWTTGPRESWENLKASYKPSYNVGVRLGSPSKIGDKYLSVLDIDVKSTELKHKTEAEIAVRELFPTLPETIIQVMSGRGNGSSHIYVLTKEPAAPNKKKTSSERIKVLMPSTPINPSQREHLSEEDLNEGWRMRPAWEVAVMGEGQQVVLPPSLHPDTSKEYHWKTRIERPSDLFEIELTGKKKEEQRTTTSDWVPDNINLFDSNLSDEIIDLIIDADCDDRSAAIFKVSIAMIKENYTDTQIMSVLTDTSYALGKVSYVHAKTESRDRAANWVFNYTLKKARLEADARFQFNEDVEVKELTEAEAEAQVKELQAGLDWKSRIERHGPKGANANTPKHTLKNLILILTNEVAEDVFKRDEFSYKEFYGHSTPWGGVKGASISDSDALKIKVWLSSRFRFEPKKDLVFEAMSYLAGKNSFDPVKDWLEALPEWDETNRLDTWLKKNFEAEGNAEYLAQVFRKWMVAMVMRVYKPGAKFDWMPIFEGKQGIGKSSIGRLLVGDKYFVDWLPDLTNKDSALALQGAWAVELGELASLRKQDVESSKAFITRTIDKVRPPYGRLSIESPRRCVFFGTTNNETYLRDESGNRRFKPVKVGQLNFDAIETDREQLFSEALFIYKNHFETSKTLDMEGEAKDYELEIQNDKMVEDESTNMREKLLDFLRKSAQEIEDSGINLSKFRVDELIDNPGIALAVRGDSRTRYFITKALKALGATKRKSHGINYWNLKNTFGDSSGIVKKVTIPVQNFSNFNN